MQQRQKFVDISVQERQQLKERPDTSIRRILVSSTSGLLWTGSCASELHA
jgi:hypothetical protein